MGNIMTKLSLTFAAVLTMGLCFAQSGAYAQAAEDALPLAAEPPEGAEEPEAPVEDVDHPGAGGVLENDPRVDGRIENDPGGAGGRFEVPPDEGAEMPPDEGAEMPPDEDAEMLPDEL